MAQVVGRRPITVKAWVWSQVSPSEICGGQSSNVAGFSPSPLVFRCQYHSTMASYSSSSTFCSYQKDKQAKPGNLPKSNAGLDLKKRWIEITSAWCL
jgi:hypothetical protein